MEDKTESIVRGIVLVIVMVILLTVIYVIGNRAGDLRDKYEDNQFVFTVDDKRYEMVDDEIWFYIELISSDEKLNYWINVDDDVYYSLEEGDTIYFCIDNLNGD